MKIRSWHKLLLALLVFVLGSATARADDVFVPPMPKDPDKVDVYLLTVGRGSAVYALFGHTILRVVDRESGLDMGFNWGIFDFQNPNFAWKFYEGDLDYQLAIMTFPELVRHYRDFEQRRIVQDRINLTPTQKLKLYERLRENARPENVTYKYFQFRDNCSTRPRNHLDAALGGLIKQHYGERLARLRFRDHIRGGANASWWVYLGLDQLSNSMLDRPVTNWDEMFLPSRFRELMKELPSVDDAGREHPELPLLTESQVIIDLPEPPIGPDAYFLVNLIIGLPLLLACVLWSRKAEPSSGVRRFYGLMGSVFGLWLAIWGTIMMLNWMLSLYDELQHNAALLLFWPVDWLFVAYGLSCLLIKAQPRPDGKLVRSAHALAVLHLVSAAVLLALWATGIVKQDVLAILGSSGWMACVYWLSIVLHQRLLRGRS